MLRSRRAPGESLTAINLLAKWTRAPQIRNRDLLCRARHVHAEYVAVQKRTGFDLRQGEVQIEAARLCAYEVCGIRQPLMEVGVIGAPAPAQALARVQQRRDVP